MIELLKRHGRFITGDNICNRQANELTRRVLLVLAWSLICSCSEPPPEISFSYLSTNERIEIAYSSIGCFHHDACTFVFQGGSPVRVDIWNDRNKRASLIKSLTISSDQLMGLDNMLYMTRQKMQGGSTTTVRMSLELYRDESLVAKEDYVDDVNASGHVQGIMTLGWILECARNNSIITEYPVEEGSADIADIRESLGQYPRRH